jgi:hypothetical protein
MHEMTERNVALVNVGANSLHGSLRSPIFEDHTFEFVPIPDPILKMTRAREGIRYKDLKPLNGVKYEEFIPPRYLNEFVHADPEFRGFTYGDYPDHSPRASNLRKLSAGDFLLFFSRLVPWVDGRYLNRAGFYFIGYFEIDSIFKRITRRPNKTTLRQIQENAHIIRGRCDALLYDGFWIIKGTRKSKRFRKAIPLNRKTVERLGLVDRLGYEWKWSKFSCDNAAIGSYLRSVRVLNWDRIGSVLRIRDYCW